MSNLKVLPTTGHANCNGDVAQFLRTMADGIEEGLYGEVRQLVATIEAAGEIDTWVAGGPCDYARIIGLMNLATVKYMYRD